MLRGCNFTYAGIDSRDYNLELYFVDTSYDRATSGGSFEIVSNKIPYHPETVLYGLDYSANPISFDIEIIDPHGTISRDDMAEIKEWLFGQNGWKKFTVDDEDFDGLYLNCILTPDEDILDTSGYRGLKCVLTNISPFWYGDDITVELNKTDNSTTTIQIQSHNSDKIYPIIEFNVPSNTNKISFSNTNGDENSIFEIEKTNAFTSGNYIFDTRNCILKCNNTVVSLTGLKPNVDLFYLLKGENTITVNGIDGTTIPTITYTPMYRVGGF